MYKKNPVSLMFLRGRHDTSLGLLDGISPRSVIDVGCDDGLFISRFAGKFPEARITAIDYDRETLAEAKRECPRATFMEGDFMALAPEPADLIVMLEVLEHSKDPLAMLRKAAKLAGKGNVLVSIPRPEVLHWRLIWWAWSNTLGRRWLGQHSGLTEAELLEMAGKAGLRLAKRKRFFLGSISIMLFKVV